MSPALADLKLHSRGKVREIYELEDDLLLVASDRISAYDVILPDPIPDKGAVLTQMSIFWFDLLGDVCPNHFLSKDVPPEAARRGMRVRKLEMYPVECVVRGYLSGSGWKEYRESGAVCGIELPEGLTESEKLPSRSSPRPRRRSSASTTRTSTSSALRRSWATAASWSGCGTSRSRSTAAPPSTPPSGDHPRRHQVRVRPPPRRRDRARRRGPDPDSSRFWPADEYEPGRGQRSFDKQYVRDWLDASGWDHTPPAPELPAEVIENTRARYVEAYERLSERDFDASR